VLNPVAIVVKKTLTVIGNKENLTAVKVTTSTYESVIQTYTKVKKQEFFRNNSTKIMSSDATTLFQIIDIINKNLIVEVYLEGVATNTLNPSINEQLSLKKTAVVEQFLICKGIHPT
jgi:outer membrane protein OmpA-like peptidoglycan-associated protein